MTTRQHIIQTTAELIKESGFHGTGIREILRRVNIPRGSLYHHFPGGKVEIIEKALEMAASEMALSFKEAMKGKDAVSGLKAVVDLYIRDLEEDRVGYGCPLASVSVDIASDNEQLREVCVNMFNFWIDAIESYLRYKKIEGNVKDKAERFLILLEGAILMSKVRQSPVPLTLIKQDIKWILK